MISEDPIAIVQSFNNCINNMIEGWKGFFSMFPEYKNTFSKIEAIDNFVSVLGFAFWSEKEPNDPVIWTAIIDENLISEWRIYEDSPGNRKKFNLV